MCIYIEHDSLNEAWGKNRPPGELRRRIALRFCEVTQREFEIVSLSRDTTEADLKQRREIVGNSVRFFDQAAFRAAVEGRVLILEGLEKAERNILPLLNNLLENREMVGFPGVVG